jgi:hypothetical protein
MNSPKARTLPQPQMTLEAFGDATVCDSAGVIRRSQVVLRGRVDPAGGWVLAFHDAGDPLRGDVLSGDEPEVAQTLLTFWKAVAAAR